MSSAKRFGGHFSDYIELHQWFDATKEMGVPNAAHRMFRHHAEGIGWAIEKFGNWIEIKMPDGSPRFISVRMLGEQHMNEDFGHVPTMADWAKCLTIQPWMFKNAIARPDRLIEEPVDAPKEKHNGGRPG